MSMIDSIAAASMSMSAAKLQMDVSTSLTKKVMDSQEQQAAQLLEQFAAAVPPPSGHKIDILA